MVIEILPIENFTNKIFNDDCLNILRQIPDESIDLVVTDPPYALTSIVKRFGKKDSAKAKYGSDGRYQRLSGGFMGKEWDSDIPSLEIWQEILRVMKSGAFAFIMCSARQDSQLKMLNRLNEAGFVIGFSSIYWVYCSGFPKAANTSLMIDKRECKKQLTEKLGRKPTRKEFDEAWEGFRKVVGRNQYAEIREKWKASGEIYEYNKQNFDYSKNLNITEPRTEKAKEFDGSFLGFQPKPAVEVIFVAMKPLTKNSYIEQVLDNGHGITWLDNVRIPYEKNCRLQKGGSYQGNRRGSNKKSIFQQGNKVINYNYELPMGRFPSNLLVSNNAIDDGRITKSPSGKVSRKPRRDDGIFTEKNSGFKMENVIDSGYGDVGGISRYFSLDAWWQEKIKSLPENVQKTFPFLIVPKPSKSEKDIGCEKLPKKQSNPNYGSGGFKRPTNEPMRETKPKGNFHPTVKSIKLGSYLVMLGSREGDVVLDPFAGSGSFLISALINNRNYIGIEMEKDYYEIARKRLEYWSMSESDRRKYINKIQRIQRVESDKKQMLLNDFEVY